MSPFPRRAPRNLPVAIAAGIVALGLLAGATSSFAEPSGQSARSQRAEVRAQQARVAAQVDALEGDQSEVEAALVALDENVRGQQAALTDARHQVELSTAEAARAEQAMAELNVELEDLRAKVATYAVEAYVSPPEEDVLRRFDADSAQEDATKRAFLDLRSGRDADVLDQLRSARQRLDDERLRAERAKAAAEAATVEADQALASLSDAQAEQQAFAEQVRTRLDERLSDAAHLSRVDAELGRQIAAEQAALVQAVARIPDQRTNPPGNAPNAGGQSGGSGTTTTTRVPGGVSPSPTTTTTTTTPPSTTPPTTPNRPPLVTVGGITVNAAIESQLRGLLSAASSAGVFLNGYGWRDSYNQIALRRQNCGTSDYAVYQMPPDQCSPPTARPGMSMHEQGLAIDFSVNGKFITSRSDPAFVWLAANAGRFGFANLPSEPWHWSTTGG